MEVAAGDAPANGSCPSGLDSASGVERTLVLAIVLEIACWNGEIVQMGFALDCHDREALATVEAARDLCGADIQLLMQRAVAHRFGANQRPDAPIQWLSDNGSIYTALDTLCTAERLNLVPITTPAQSPESNGMSEAFVNTMRRDYIDGADLAHRRTRARANSRLDRGLQCRRSALGARLPLTPPIPGGNLTVECDSVA